MTNSSFLTISGLIFDIIGAVYLAKGIFFESIDVAVDKGGIEIPETKYSGEIFYLKKAQRILDRCSEITWTRVGLAFLILGFLLQIIGQIIDTSFFFSCTDSTYLLLIIIILLIPALFIVWKVDKSYKKKSCFEFINRITPNGINHPLYPDQINLPVGMSIDTINKIAKLFKSQDQLWAEVQKNYNALKANSLNRAPRNNRKSSK